MKSQVAFGLSRFAEIRSSLEQYKQETKAAQKLNENAIRALHGWKNVEQILSFMLEHDRAMKRKYSKAKILWMRAIHKVVTMKDLAKVHTKSVPSCTIDS